MDKIKHCPKCHSFPYDPILFRCSGNMAYWCSNAAWLRPDPRSEREAALAAACEEIQRMGEKWRKKEKRLPSSPWKDGDYAAHLTALDEEEFLANNEVWMNKED